MLSLIQRGDIIGIRGPFGFGWPVEEMKGKDVPWLPAVLALLPTSGNQVYSGTPDQYGKFEIPVWVQDT